MTEPFDIAIAGAGPAGLATAIALAREGFRTALIGPVGAARDGRTVALLNGSVNFLKAIGAWQPVAADAAPLSVMRMVDDTGSLFRPPPVNFSAGELGLDAFGYNIENAVLVEHLAKIAATTAGLELVPRLVAGFAADHEAAIITLDNGERLTARLAVAADGRHSLMRQAAGIGVRKWSYPQIAVTAILAHDQAHGDASTEFHTRAGPFTLVPLPGKRSSLVWVNRPEDARRLTALDDTAFAKAVEKQARGMLGAMRLDGPRGSVPLSGLTARAFTATRLALAGEAAHVFPPIGAQGLNLGLRDGAALRDAVVAARRAAQDIGSEGALNSYARGRAFDTGVRTNAIDLLNRMLLTPWLPVDFLRGAGLLALDLVGPLRKAVMREGLAPRFGIPELMRGETGKAAAEVLTPSPDRTQWNHA